MTIIIVIKLLKKKEKTVSDLFSLCSDGRFDKLNTEKGEAVKRLSIPKAQGMGSTKTLGGGGSYT